LCKMISFWCSLFKKAKIELWLLEICIEYVDLTQGPLKKWTEHSQELYLLKIHSRGGSYYTPWLDGGWFFGPWAFIILKSSYQDLSNEGSIFFLSSLELVFKLLKHRHFWINFRFWLKNQSSEFTEFSTKTWKISNWVMTSAIICIEK